MQGLRTIAYLNSESEHAYVKRSPDEALWWRVFTDGVRMAVLDVLNKRGVQKSKQNKFYRKGQGLNWLMDDSETGVGSVRWMVAALGIDFLPEIREFLETADDKRLIAVSKALT